MMPGLHPGLLLSGRAIIFEGVPPYLWIDTRGGPGTRILSLPLTLKNGKAPFFFEWEINLFGMPAVTPMPSSGFGNSATPNVSFSSDIYYDGAATFFTEVGTAFLMVTDANGRSSRLDLPIYAGGDGSEGGPV